MEKSHDERRAAFCPLCNTTVAPYAPDRMPVGKTVYHRGCFKRLSNWDQANLLDTALGRRTVGFPKGA